MINIQKIIDHIRHRKYMGGLDRDALRIKATAEVFTPTHTVQKILDKADPTVFKDQDKMVLDQSCGDGQFLGEALIRKLENGIDFKTALSTIYGVDIMQDNVELCRERLLCGQEDLRHIVETNIVCHDASTYDYSFNGTNKTEDELRFDNLFTIE